jgi:hypothetical protein
MLKCHGLAVALFAALAPVQAAPNANIDTFFPTSEIIHMAETIARAEGYDLSDHKNYYFDLVQGRDGKPLIPGYVALEFYYGGDLIQTIAIDDHSGMAINMTACRIFDYPALRFYRASTAVTTNASVALKAHTGCDNFTLKRIPKRASRSYRR